MIRLSEYQGIREAEKKKRGNEQMMKKSYLISRYPDIHFLIAWYSDNLLV